MKSQLDDGGGGYAAGSAGRTHDFYMIDCEGRRGGAGAGTYWSLGLTVTSTDLSGGQRTKVSAGESCCWRSRRSLLLDEPTNYLDAEHIVWLKRYLQEYENAFILICHDIPFLNSVDQL